MAPLIFNACLFLSFFAAAEIFRHYLMSRSLLAHKPERLESSSFLSSVLNYDPYLRSPHASFREAGKTYHWSYLERRFVEVP
jgi:hypothetical protein